MAAYRCFNFHPTVRSISCVIVAEASGNALSANIVSDNVTLALSPRCSASSTRMWSAYELQVRAASYSDQYYRAANGTEGRKLLNYQGVPYTEVANGFCPFGGNHCALHSKPSYTFDTLFFHARYMGINTPNKIYFRSTPVYAPLTSDTGTERRSLGSWCDSTRDPGSSEQSESRRLCRRQLERDGPGPEGIPRGSV